MQTRDTIVQILTSGPGVEVKAALAGGALLMSNLWEAYTSLAFVALLIFAIADFLSGVARALNEGGLAAWDDRKAFKAVIKLIVAASIVAVGITMDTLAHATGVVQPDTWGAFSAACTIMGGIYVGSALKNADSFFPGISGLVEYFRQGRPPPDQREDDKDE